MPNQLIPLSTEHQTILSMAAKALSEQQLRNEISQALTWAPSLQRCEHSYSIPEKSLAPRIWNALLELEEWGLAYHSTTPCKEEILHADKAVFELVIEAIRVLLETILQILAGQAVEPGSTPKPPAQSSEQRPFQRQPDTAPQGLW